MVCYYLCFNWLINVSKYSLFYGFPKYMIINKQKMFDGFLKSFSNEHGKNYYWRWKYFQFYGCYHFHCNNVDWWNAISAPGGEMGTHLAVRHIIITRHHVMWWYLAIVTSPAPAIVMWRVSSQQQQSDQIRAIISRKRWRVETQKQSDWFYFFYINVKCHGFGIEYHKSLSLDGRTYRQLL